MTKGYHFLLATIAAGVAAITTGCGLSAREPDASTPPTTPSVAVAPASPGSAVPSAEPPTHLYTHAGLTVRLPAECRPADVSPRECAGLMSLKVAVVGPLDDLIRSGVYRQDNGWTGLRLVGRSYIFATSRTRSGLVDVLDSAMDS